MAHGPQLDDLQETISGLQGINRVDEIFCNVLGALRMGPLPPSGPYGPGDHRFYRKPRRHLEGRASCGPPEAASASRYSW